MPKRSDVLAAEARVREHLRRTPLVQVKGHPYQLWFKCEFMQHTGSFKARGALNRVLTAQDRGELDPAVGVVAASGGNAGLANAYAATSVGVPATVFVPLTAPAVKVARIREYGGIVHQVGTQYPEAFEAAMDHASQTGAVFCHSYDQLDVVAGAGTLGDEIVGDEPSVETIIVAVGGGGLLAGILAAVDERVRVIAVEPWACATLNEALSAGKPVDVPVSGLAADSLGARRIGDIAFDTVARKGVTSVLVDEAQIVAARAHLWDEYRVAAEHGAATAYAALTSGTYVPAEGERTCVVLCGANTDPSTLLVS